MPGAWPRLGKDQVQGGEGEPDVRPTGQRPGDALLGAAAREGCSGPLEGPGRTWSEDGVIPLSTQRRARPPSGERPPPRSEHPAGVALNQTLRAASEGPWRAPSRPPGGRGKARLAQGTWEGCCHQGRQGWDEMSRSALCLVKVERHP